MRAALRRERCRLLTEKRVVLGFCVMNPVPKKPLITFVSIAMIALSVGCLFYRFGNPENVGEAVQPKPESIVPKSSGVISAPNLVKKESAIDSPQPENSLEADTREYLSLVEKSDSAQDVFKTPGKHVFAQLVDGHWVTQGDLLVGEANLVDDIGDSERRLARIEKTQHWADNTVPYQISSGLDAQKIFAAIEMLHSQTAVRFVEHSGEPDFVVFQPSQQNLSYLGKKGGLQEILLDPNNTSPGIILHEMMHTIGFIHEHSRTDRDRFLTVHWENIDPAYQAQFQIMTPELSLTEVSDFDFESILLYSSQAFTTSDMPSMTKKDGTRFKVNHSRLSQGDVAKVNHLYPET